MQPKATTFINNIFPYCYLDTLKLSLNKLLHNTRFYTKLSQLHTSFKNFRMWQLIKRLNWFSLKLAAWASILPSASFKSSFFESPLLYHSLGLDTCFTFVCKVKRKLKTIRIISINQFYWLLSSKQLIFWGSIFIEWICRVFYF